MLAGRLKRTDESPLSSSCEPFELSASHQMIYVGRNLLLPLYQFLICLLRRRLRPVAICECVYRHGERATFTYTQSQTDLVLNTSLKKKSGHRLVDGSRIYQR
jgi:hypothetical protein